MRPQRIWAVVIGTGFVVVGLLRFVPLAGLPGWESPEPVHGALHLVSGTLWVLTARTQHVRRANRWLGLFWLAIGLAGNLRLLGSVEALAFDDNAVHLIVGVIGVAVGWGPRRA